MSRLEKLSEHVQDLTAHGIAVVETKMENGVCVMPRMDAEVGQAYLKKLLQTDVEQLLREMEHFRDLILQSSEIVKSDRGDGDGEGVRLSRYGTVEQFLHRWKLCFFDQEFCEENYPANVIITRMSNTFYSGNEEMEKLLSINTLYERYGLEKYRERWAKIEWKFLMNLRKEKELRKYHERCRAGREIINANRQGTNYEEEEYQRLFVDIFRNSDTKN